MSIALLATGDEIVLGDTLNTNAQRIAHTLQSEGLPIGFHLSCSDDETMMHRSLAFLADHHEVVIVIGGLGPTSDDRTRYALARYAKEDLIEFPDALVHIKERLCSAHLSLNEGNRQQALFPKEAVLLPNAFGTAMGFYFYCNNKLFISLPGPPSECLPMFEHYVLPILQKHQHVDKKIIKWRLFGVAEGEIGERLDAALKNISCETGYRLEMPYLEFKVRCYEKDCLQIQQIIEPLVAPHIIASIQQKASERLIQQIVALQIPVVISDEATGGVLQSIIHHPSTYPWLYFQPHADIPLHFQITGLDEYWKQAERGGTHITIKYNNEMKVGSETHTIPYRSSLVLHYAAEWLCFRLFHLIDQLH